MISQTKSEGVSSTTLVSDSPQSFASGSSQSLSMTSEGRLRVSAVITNGDQLAWQSTFNDPWGNADNPRSSMEVW